MLTPKQLRALKKSKNMSTPEWQAVIEAVYNLLGDDWLTYDELFQRANKQLGIDDHVVGNCWYHLCFAGRTLVDRILVDRRVVNSAKKNQTKVSSPRLVNSLIRNQATHPANAPYRKDNANEEAG
jgi:hypothetical protein